MVIGTLGAAVAGAGMPFFAVIFGSTINDLQPNSTPNQVYDSISKTSMWFGIVGGIVFFAFWVMVACWMSTGEQ